MSFISIKGAGVFHRGTFHRGTFHRGTFPRRHLSSQAVSPPGLKMNLFVATFRAENELSKSSLRLALAALVSEL